MGMSWKLKPPSSKSRDKLERDLCTQRKVCKGLMAHIIESAFSVRNLDDFSNLSLLYETGSFG